MKQTYWLLPAFLLSVVPIVALAERGPQRTQKRAEPSLADDEAPSLAMTPAVACATIDGYEDFTPLPGAATSSEEKLLVYYRPLGYRVERTGLTNHIHLVQDGQIRRRGEKKVLMAKMKLLDYDWKSREPANPVYFRTMVGLKGLTPGEYELDITLHDMLAPGEPTARQVLPFRVIPSGPRDEKGTPKP